MKLEEVEILRNLQEYLQNKLDNGLPKLNYNELMWDFKTVDAINVIDIALQELDRLQKENEELKEKIIEVEKENQVQKAVIFEDSISKDKIRELIEMWKPKLEETDKREEKAKTQEERVVLKCIGIRLDERIKTLQDLLKEE